MVIDTDYLGDLPALDRLDHLAIGRTGRHHLVEPVLPPAEPFGPEHSDNDVALLLAVAPADGFLFVEAG